MHEIKEAKASFTIEMACLMPMFLLVIIGSIYLCFFVHNRAWLTAAAYESALVGCQELQTDRDHAETAAYERGKILLSPRLYGAENLQMQVNLEGKTMNVQFDGDTVATYGGLAWHIQAKASEKYVDPVSFIWKLKGLEGLGKH